MEENIGQPIITSEIKHTSCKKVFIVVLGVVLIIFVFFICLNNKTLENLKAQELELYENHIKITSPINAELSDIAYKLAISKAKTVTSNTEEKIILTPIKKDEVPLSKEQIAENNKLTEEFGKILIKKDQEVILTQEDESLLLEKQANLRLKLDEENKSYMIEKERIEALIKK